MRLIRFVVASLITLSLFSGSAAALAVPPVPKDIPIVDQAEVLTSEQEQSIAQKIATERAKTGNQLGILTITSLEGDSLEDYSLKVAREWGIGTKERNSGALLLVVIEDRRLRIEVGYGLEGALPDIRVNRIIEERIKPAFRQGHYASGISSGVDGILLAIHDEQDPQLTDNPGPTGQSGRAGLPWELIIGGLVFIPTWLGAMLARTKSWWAGGVLGLIIAAIIVLFVGFAILSIIALIALPIIGLLFDKAVSKNYHERARNGMAPSWWAGGTHIGGSGNGGFGGFGGGGFGGGGASGDW